MAEIKMYRQREGEREIVKRILAGERLAFERFYHRYSAELRRYLRTRIRNGEDVEEVVQDSFLALLDSLPLFSFRSSLKTFLHSIARHEAADYWRRRYAKRALKLVPFFGEMMSEQLYTTAQLSEAIERVYRRLGRGQARILQMKYEEGMSVKQIALSLKMSVKAAESALFRARKAFQLVYLRWERGIDEAEGF